MTPSLRIVSVLFVVVCGLMLATVHAPVVAAQAVRSPAALIVVDAVGKKIGNVISIREDPGTLAQALVAFEANGLLAVIEVRRFGFQGGDGLYFTLPDCEGDPYVALWGSVPLGSLGAPGITVYVPDPTSPVPTTQTFQSVEFSPGQCQSTTQDASPLFHFRAVPLVNLEGLFTPPFLVKPATVKGGK